jgi:hypothetical protein
MSQTLNPAAASADDTAAAPAETEPWAEFRQALLSSGLLIPSGVDGLYGRSGTYESVADAMDRLVLRTG